MPRQRLPLATCLLGLCAVAALTARAQADAVSDFYRGKTVTIIVGTPKDIVEEARKAIAP